jgi:hydroxyacylglutathione hydrolase
MTGKIIVESAELGVLGTRGFLVWREGQRQALLIDFPDGVASWVRAMELKHGIEVRTMVLTHGHWDHLSGYKELLQYWTESPRSVSLYAHVGDRPFIENPENMRSFALPGISLVPPAVNHWWDTLPVEWCEHGIDWQVRHVPGHAPGNILLYCEEGGFAVVGDVIFRESVGRYDLPLASWPQLQDSIRNQIYTLPVDTVLMPGHGPNTTVAWERRWNPYVSDRGDDSSS